MPSPQQAPVPRKLTPVPPALPRRPPAPPLAAPRAEVEDSIDRAFDHLVAPAKAAGAKPATSAADLAELQGTYLELAVAYCAPVRNVMLEVRFGEPPMLWLEQVGSALRALRAMSVEVELGALAAALEGFNGAVAAALASGEATVIGQHREALLAAYAPLCAALPRAFDLEGERDRREPIILRALLRLVPGLSPLAVDRFFSAGLGRLDAIAQARAEELAAVTGLDAALAGQVVEQVRAERSLTADLGQERQRLGALTARLGEEQRAFEQAAAGWSAERQTDKRRWRRQREQSWLRIEISLARLGEAERLERLERLPYARRLEALDGFLRA
jgi:hypothetical protein